MKIHCTVYPNNEMVRRGLGRGGAGSCPNAENPGGRAACGLGASQM